MAKKKRRSTGNRTRRSGASQRGAVRQRGPATRNRVSRAVVLSAASTIGIALIAFAVFLHSRTNTGAVATTIPALSAAPTLASRIDGIPCNTQDISYHVHAHLQIVYEGKNLAVPANIGIHGNTCLYYLHTHDNSGELHIESPVVYRFTLGQFFDIWQQPLSSTRVATLHVPAGKHLRIYVGGKRYSGDPRTISLSAHRLIALEIGPPFIHPAAFDFQGD